MRIDDPDKIAKSSETLSEEISQMIRVSIIFFLRKKSLRVIPFFLHPEGAESHLRSK